MVFPSVLLAVVLLSGVGAGQTTYDPLIVTVAVQPATRDGFVDVNARVFDSISDLIKDLETPEARGYLRVVPDPEKADLVLWVVARGVGSEARGMAISAVEAYGGVQVTATEIRRSTFWLETILEAGRYRKQVTGTSSSNGGPLWGPWTECAKKIHRELESWIFANRAAIIARRGPR